MRISNRYTSEKRTSIRGRVIRGRQIGRELGFPTANVNAYVGNLQSGVYGVVGTLKGNKYWGIMNIGVKPTFESTLRKTVVVHLFDFYKEVYGESIDCQILFKVREEQKFPSPECLKQQIHADMFIMQSKDLTALKDIKKRVYHKMSKKCKLYTIKMK